MLTTRGESHGVGLMAIIDKCRRISLDESVVLPDLDRRRPVLRYGTPRNEGDKVRSSPCLWVQTTGTLAFWLMPRRALRTIALP